MAWFLMALSSYSIGLQEDLQRVKDSTRLRLHELLIKCFHIYVQTHLVHRSSMLNLVLLFQA